MNIRVHCSHVYTAFLHAGGPLLKNHLNSHLKVIGLVLVIQVYFLLKDREWVSYKKMRYVLGQELVDAYSHRMHYSFHYCAITSFRISPVAKTFVFSESVPALSSCL